MGKNKLSTLLSKEELVNILASNYVTSEGSFLIICYMVYRDKESHHEMLMRHMVNYPRYNDKVGGKLP